MALRMVLVVVDDDDVGLKRSFPDAVAAIVDAARVVGPLKRHVVVKHAARVAGSLTQFRSSDVAAAAGEVLIRHGCEVRIVELETFLEESLLEEGAALMASLREQKHCAESYLAQSEAAASTAAAGTAAAFTGCQAQVFSCNHNMTTTLARGYGE